MAESKRFYWLKLKDDFFEQKETKKLRSIAGGDTYTCIYLKMLLRSLKSGGVMCYEGFEDTFAEEIALDIDEGPDDVTVVLQFLEKYHLVEYSESGSELKLTATENMTISEGMSAERMRRMRKKEDAPKIETSQCDAHVTERDENVRTENHIVQKSGEEIEKEIEIDKEIDKEIERDRDARGRESGTSDDVCETKSHEKTFADVIPDDLPNASKRAELKQVINAWNDLVPYGIQPVKSIKSSSKRYKSLNARLNEYALRDMLDAINNIKNSRFLRGQNSRGWTITFDWFVLPSNFIKVLEGNYNDKLADTAMSGAYVAGNNATRDAPHIIGGVNYSGLNQFLQGGS